MACIMALPPGYSSGDFEGRRWGVTVSVSPDRRRWWVFAEALGGTETVSLNLYALQSGVRLKPCEMPAARAAAFLCGYRPRQRDG